MAKDLRRGTYVGERSLSLADLKVPYGVTLHLIRDISALYADPSFYREGLCGWVSVPGLPVRIKILVEGHVHVDAKDDNGKDHAYIRDAQTLRSFFPDGDGNGVIAQRTMAGTLDWFQSPEAIIVVEHGALALMGERPSRFFGTSYRAPNYDNIYASISHALALAARLRDAAGMFAEEPDEDAFIDAVLSGPKAYSNLVLSFEKCPETARAAAHLGTRATA